MSTDLEMLLRSTLAGRADTIKYGPQWAGPNAHGPNRNRRWLAAAAAAAAVIAIGAGVVAVRDTRHNSPPPATQVPSPTRPAPTPTPTTHRSSTPSPVNDVTQLPSCATTLPSAWTNALQNSVVNIGGRTVSPLAVAPDKSIVALRDDGVTPGSKREVVYVSPGGTASVVYTIKDPDYTSVQLGAVSGPWLVLGLWNDPRPPKNTIPGSSSIGLQGVVVVNLENRSTKLIGGTDRAVTQRNPGRHIQSVAVDNGIVYWDEEASYGDTIGTLWSYNLSTRALADIYTGPIGYVTARAAGVGWPDPQGGGFTFVVRHQLPAAVASAMNQSTETSLSTDGTSYAWLGSQADAYWWTKGLAKPVHLKLPRGVAVNVQDYGGTLFVVGHLLITDPPMVIDMHTGAVAPLPTSGIFGAERGELIDHSGPVFDGLAFTGTAGHYENGYWADTATSLLRVDISGLPGLSC